MEKRFKHLRRSFFFFFLIREREIIVDPKRDYFVPLKRCNPTLLNRGRHENGVEKWRERFPFEHNLEPVILVSIL